MKPQDLEVLKDFLLERMDPADAELVLSVAKNTDATRTLIDRPVDHEYCVCGARGYEYDEYGDRGGALGAHTCRCPVVLALQALKHPALGALVDHEHCRADDMYRAYRETQQYVVPEHWVIDTETVGEHAFRRRALLHPSVIAARRGGAAQEDIENLVATDPSDGLLDDA